MTHREPITRRVFDVTKDDGSRYLMKFTSSGITWEPLVGDPRSEAAPTSPGGPAPTVPTSRTVAAVAMVSELADAAAQILVWWELRQGRLLAEGQAEEAKRLPWLADMLGRWAEAHRGGGHLDLRVTEYLAREAAETANAIVSSKRVAVPQALLLELDVVLQTLASARRALTAQFEAFHQDASAEVSHALATAFPRRKLDIGFLRRLGADPAVAWARAVRSKKPDALDPALDDVLIDPDSFMARLLPTTEVSVWDGQKDSGGGNVLEHVVSLIVQALPKPDPGESRAVSMERLDPFRELALLRLEVTRVKALHAAWLAISAAVESELQRPLEVVLGADHLVIDAGERRVAHTPNDVMEANQSARPA